MARIHTSAAATITHDAVRRRRRLLTAGVCAAAAIGLAAPLTYFWASSPGVPVSVASTVSPKNPEKIAAFVAPTGSPVMEAQPAPATVEPRVGRIDLAAEPETRMLADNDPRWARATTASAPDLPEPVETTELRRKIAQIRNPAAEAAARRQPPDSLPTDATLTGTISPGHRAEPAAETAAETPAEPDQPTAEIAAAAPQAAPEEPAATTGQSGGVTRTAQVTTHVNMRSGPENEAAVVTVLPTGTSVEVIGCEVWCEVDFDGKRGYVYKTFISGS